MPRAAPRASSRLPQPHKRDTAREGRGAARGTSERLGGIPLYSVSPKAAEGVVGASECAAPGFQLVFLGRFGMARTRSARIAHALPRVRAHGLHATAMGLWMGRRPHWRGAHVCDASEQRASSARAARDVPIAPILGTGDAQGTLCAREALYVSYFSLAYS